MRFVAVAEKNAHNHWLAVTKRAGETRPRILLSGCPEGFYCCLRREEANGSAAGRKMNLVLLAECKG